MFDKDELLESVGIILGILLILAAWAGVAWVTMLLWNNIIVGTFGLPVLTFWKTCGLIFIGHVIFPSNYGSKKD